MTDPLARKGFKMITGTSEVDCTDTPLGGFTAVGDTVIASLTCPSSINSVPYSSDAANFTSITIKDGAFLPIAVKKITLTSGKLIGWLE